jgi:anaerobic ribonucleoside-triphosphate reductase activating protein
MATQIPSLSAPPGYRPQAHDTSSESDQMEIHILKNGSRLITGYWGQMSLTD